MGKYNAWIPNVSGAISFSNIKGERIPGRAKCPKTINHLGPGASGTIASLQERNLSDTLYAPFDPDGWLCYLLIAEKVDDSSGHEFLLGEVYTYPRVRLDKTQKNLVKNFFNDSSAATSLRDSWSAKPEAVRVSFELHRDGRIKLDYQGHDVNNESSFVFEAFSFLKDLIHCHKFHRNDDDAIVVPYPEDNANPNRWLNQSIRNIHKSIVSSYRNANFRNDVQNALGRLSYLESLQKIAPSHVQSGPPLQTINTEALRTSLEARLATVGENEDKKSVILQISIPTVISLVGLLIAMIQLIQVPCIKGLTDSAECTQRNSKLPFILQEGAFEFVQHLLSYWLYYATFIPFVIFLVYTVSYRKHIYRWISNQWGHGLFGGILRILFSIAATSKIWQIVATIFVLATVVGLVLMGYRLSFNTWPSFSLNIFHLQK